MPTPNPRALPRRRRAPPRARPRGLGVISILMVLVVLAGLAAAVVRTGRQSQLTTAQDVAALRAQSAAQSAIEWGLYQIYKGGWSACSGVSTTIDLRTSLGMRVNVSCNSVVFNEGETAPGVPRTVRIYTLEAISCNSPVSCPSGGGTGLHAGSPGYVERARQVQVMD